MVWQNQRGESLIGRGVNTAVNAGIRQANDFGAAIPEQKSLGRGMELTPLTDVWLDAMGGMKALFETCAAEGAPAM